MPEDSGILEKKLQTGSGIDFVDDKYGPEDETVEWGD